jgi:hypothetical protein
VRRTLSSAPSVFRKLMVAAFRIRFGSLSNIEPESSMIMPMATGLFPWSGTVHSVVPTLVAISPGDVMRMSTLSLPSRTGSLAASWGMVVRPSSPVA